MSLHESYKDNDDPVGSSDRGFGLVFTVIFSLVSAYLIWRGNSWWPLLAVFAASIGAMTAIQPRLLAYPNKLWTRFALLLAKITTPIILFVLFIVCFVPIGLTARLLGKDFLRLRRDPKKSSYWIDRSNAPGHASSMKNQF